METCRSNVALVSRNSSGSELCFEVCSLNKTCSGRKFGLV